MKFKISVKNVKTGNQWWEEYENPTPIYEDKPIPATPEEARQWAKDVIEWFNSTLKFKESPRKLLETIIL